MRGWSHFINIRPLKLQKDQSLSVTCTWAASLKQICLFICLDMGLFLTLPWKVQLCQFVSNGNRTVEKKDLFVKTVLQRSAHILFSSAVMIFASLFDCLFVFFLLHFFVHWMFVKMYICFLSYRTCFRNNKLFLYVFYMGKNPLIGEILNGLNAS